MTTTIIFSLQAMADPDFIATPLNMFINWVASPLASISGILCVVLAAKGKISNYWWGIPNALLYGIMAIIAGVWGDVFSNLIYFLPMQFIGIIMWKKRLSEDNKTVKMSQMTLIRWIVLAVSAVAAVLVAAILLTRFDNWFTAMFRDNEAFYGQLSAMFGLNTNYLGAVLDASTEIFQIIAGILMALALKEQWLFWIATNFVSIFTWSVIIYSDPTTVSWALPVLIMWVGFLINSFYGYTTWNKAAKLAKANQISENSVLATS